MFPTLRHMRHSRYFQRRAGNLNTGTWRHANRLAHFLSQESAALAASVTPVAASTIHTSAVAASSVLTLNATPTNGDTITIGPEIKLQYPVGGVTTNVTPNTYTFVSALTEVKATGALTSTQNYANSETVTIGANVLTFVTNLSEAKATGVYTETGNFGNGDTVKVGATTYTMQTSLTNSANNVHIGVAVANSLTNLQNAINNSGGTVGTDYGTGGAANASATAVAASTTLTLTALAVGTAGNSVATVYTAASSSEGAFGHTTLTGGVDSVAGQVKIGASESASIANLHHAINASGGTVGTDYATACVADPNVTAADDGAHIVTVTAILPGVAANSVATTETAAHASWGGATLTGGINSVQGQIKIGGSAALSATNLIHGVNASGGTVGTDYATANVADPNCTLSSPGSAQATISATVAGTASNGLEVSSSNATQTFSSAALTGGIDQAWNTFTATGHPFVDGEGPMLLDSKWTAVLTSTQNYANGETVTVGGVVYTFQTVLTNVGGNVNIGTNEAGSIANLHHAINASGGTAGTDYATATVANPYVTAADNGSHTVTVTGILPGPASVTTTRLNDPVPGVGTLTFTGNPSNSDTVTIGSKTYTFKTAITSADGDVLIGATEAASIQNLADAINLVMAQAGVEFGSASKADNNVSGVAGSTTLVVTALEKGAISIASTASSTACSWGASTLQGGMGEGVTTVPVGLAVSTTAVHATWGAANLAQAATLPGGYTSGTPFYIQVIDTNTVGARRARGSNSLLALSSTGSGTMYICRQSFPGAVFELLRRNSAAAIAGRVNNPSYASGTLTFTGQVSDGDTVTIGTRVYTFQTALTASDGDVLIGGTEAASIANLAHAINYDYTAGVLGTDYFVTTADPSVTAVPAATTLTVTALVRGSGSGVATTETSSAASWGSATLTGGVGNGQTSPDIDNLG